MKRIENIKTDFKSYYFPCAQRFVLYTISLIVFRLSDQLEISQLDVEKQANTKLEKNIIIHHPPVDNFATFNLPDKTLFQSRYDLSRTLPIILYLSAFRKCLNLLLRISENVLKLPQPCGVRLYRKSDFNKLRKSSHPLRNFQKLNL